MKPAQAVTERYVNNFIRNGANKEFNLAVINRKIHEIDGIVVGVYFTAIVARYGIAAANIQSVEAVGATPSQAIRRCLERHGVTFR